MARAARARRPAAPLVRGLRLPRRFRLRRGRDFGLGRAALLLGPQGPGFVPERAGAHGARGQRVSRRAARRFVQEADRDRADGVSSRAAPGLRRDPELRGTALDRVAATHQALRQHVGASVLTWYMPLTQSPAAAAREQLLDASWKQWVDVILADLRRAHREIDELVTHVDVWRWGHGMIKPLPGTITGTALSQARMSRRNIHFAHSDLSGMSLFEEAHYWGVQAARRAIDALS